ncbi:M12 family metallo-peptidase (plasmid) [Burkholderia sp. FERM BP-3421]|uniref:reprolysin-like metallopeptidase n=1 Tax=Burkholderia sp. FERM BP-3421 TaxID=1494466 RepID=UPI002360A6F0|nr:zinc-dependent metalloprotease family protein [Burkholderia sp. FERM BP-3421]WDD90610.1 M12 family metallo-peptidase [Burkholderia sp. FERM BP-3421]
MKNIILTCAVLAAWGCASLAQAADTAGFWHEVPASASASAALAGRGATSSVPSSYRAVTLDLGHLKTELSARAATTTTLGQGSVLALPLPEGGMTYFTLTESDVLPPALAKRYPSLKSYKGVDDKGRRARVDITPQGLQAAVYGDKDGVWLVQPAVQLSGRANKASDSGDVYWSFRRAALPGVSPFNEDGFDKNLLNGARVQKRTSRAAPGSATGARAGGNVMYEYRLAMAATSTYTKSFGGTVVDGLAAVATMVNRINEIYENDLGVHLALVPSEDKIIYTETRTDPYAGLSPGTDAINDKNVKNLAKVIGNKNFDVGHVVAGDGTGGMASIASTCQDDSKAAGSTGRLDPVGDAFAVDYVAHELGHSFGSYHSFNARRSTPEEDAVEPGEGSTIMGYAGVYGGIISYQPHTDPYFNSSSVGMIHDWIASAGGSCAKRTLNKSGAPWLDPESLVPPDAFTTGRAHYSVPARTPFTLKAKAAKGSGASVLTYTWEQFDFGPEQFGELKDDGQGPIFRSFKPHAEPEQTFPHLAAVLGDEPLGNGEVYPVTNRKLSFRVTVRDNVAMSQPLGVGPNTATGNMYLNVVDTGGAFAVTAPRAKVKWAAGSGQTIAWNVAKTDAAPIACANVRLDLSLDGGYRYLPDPLLASVPNNGAAKVTLPTVASNKARVRVSCTDNVFFAVTPTVFTIAK